MTALGIAKRPSYLRLCLWIGPLVLVGGLFGPWGLQLARDTIALQVIAGVVTILFVPGVFAYWLVCVPAEIDREVSCDLETHRVGLGKLALQKLPMVKIALRNLAFEGYAMSDALGRGDPEITEESSNEWMQRCMGFMEEAVGKSVMLIEVMAINQRIKESEDHKGMFVEMAEMMLRKANEVGEHDVFPVDLSEFVIDEDLGPRTVLLRIGKQKD